ncbi:hypothetical protein L916_05032 [Phytophthora nicotianae]|uniref:Uncharacterized protein n=1 Tax=Phytophthora nicotianae TaxID=4792 RepID=W2JGL2_PHYNI|nr:hypothetical protein L916_05032 [Phytophthora nicotianae]
MAPRRSGGSQRPYPREGPGKCMIEMRPRIYKQSLNLDWRPPNSYVRTGIRGTLGMVVKSGANLKAPL